MPRVPVLMLFILACPAYGEMYKCVDERGRTHYTDKPSAQCKGTKVDIRPIPPVSGKTAPRPGDVAGQDADFKRRQVEREELLAREKAEREHRCARLRYELGVLSAGGRVYETTAQGERVYLDDATRDARVEKLRQEVRGCP